jgi:glycerol-3-phosphate dehydrogenase
MRRPLAELANRDFDVAVIGAGINGTSAAQQLASLGYSVLLIDKADIASGSSSRSTRLLHVGLRYLAAGTSMWQQLMHPAKLAVSLRMAQQSAMARNAFATTAGERTRNFKFGFPIYCDGM